MEAVLAAPHCHGHLTQREAAATLAWHSLAAHGLCPSARCWEPTRGSGLSAPTPGPGCPHALQKAPGCNAPSPLFLPLPRIRRHVLGGPLLGLGVSSFDWAPGGLCCGGGE